MKTVRIIFEGFEKDKSIINNYILVGDYDKKLLKKKINEIIEEIFGK